MKTLYSKTREIFSNNYLRSEIKHLINELKQHHLGTYSHSMRVALLSVDVGIEKKISTKQLDSVCIGAMLHDIGKVEIPLDILAKNAVLESADREVMNSHPSLGYNKVANLFVDNIKDIIVGHHEFKKNPYPRKNIERRSRMFYDDRRKKKSSHNLTELVAAADIFDALVSKRDYKKALSLENARSVFKNQFLGDINYFEMMSRRY